MSSRTLSQLIAAAGCLLAIWFLLARVPWGSGDAESENSEDWGSFFSRLNRVTASAVQVDGPDGSKRLANDGSRWTIEGLPTDSGTVARFWVAVEEASTPSLVGRNPENHARLGLTPGDAFTLTFELEGETRTLLIGAEGPVGGSNFIRRPDADDAYLLDANLRNYLARSVSEWRDRRVVMADTAEASRIEIRGPEDSFVLSRGDSAWTLADGSGADAGAIQGLLEELATLRSNGPLEEGNPLLDQPQTSSVIALSQTGDTLAVLTLGGADGDQWVTGRGRDIVPGNDEDVFVLPRFRVDRVVPTGERLRGN